MYSWMHGTSLLYQALDLYHSTFSARTDEKRKMEREGERERWGERERERERKRKREGQ
jgi:hypothetical protein